MYIGGGGYVGAMDEEENWGYILNTKVGQLTLEGGSTGVDLTNAGVGIHAKNEVV